MNGGPPPRGYGQQQHPQQTHPQQTHPQQMHLYGGMMQPYYPPQSMPYPMMGAAEPQYPGQPIMMGALSPQHPYGAMPPPHAVHVAAATLAYGMPTTAAAPVYNSCVAPSSSGNGARAAAPVPATNTAAPSLDLSKDWKPCEKDAAQMDKWFFEIDTTGTGYIGGAQAVAFLKNSNLSRDTLRAIWSLVDAHNTGRVDLYQVRFSPPRQS